MYSPQLFEMISQSVHAERIANAERHRFASAAVDPSTTMRASPDDASHRRLGRDLLILALRSARLRCAPNRTPAGSQ
jgi:hypothetical protein